MLTPQQISVILESGNSVSFDGTNFTITDASNTATIIANSDVQDSINSISVSMAALQTNMANESNQLLGLTSLTNVLVSFQASNTSAIPVPELPVNINPTVVETPTYSQTSQPASQ